MTEVRLSKRDQESYLPRANDVDEFYLEDDDLWVYIGSHS
jgi:hypothetical protein